MVDPNVEVTAIDILEKVNAFYNNAWINLITIFTILLAFVGFIWPFLVNSYFKWKQNEAIALKEKEVEWHLTKLFNEKYKELEDKHYKLDANLNITINKLESTFLKDHIDIKGDHATEIGDVYYNLENYDNAFKSYITAMTYYLIVINESKIRILVDNIGRCYVSISDKYLINNLKLYLNDPIEKLRALNINGRFNKEIFNLEGIIKSKT